MSRNEGKPGAAPEVWIFWLVVGKLLIDRTPVAGSNGPDCGVRTFPMTPIIGSVLRSRRLTEQISVSGCAVSYGFRAKKHWSSGDTKERALFYQESSGKFDLIPMK